MVLDDEPTPVVLPEEPEPLAELPEVEEPVLDALFSRAWPVAWSLQCVAADTSELPLADGDVDD
jgi:hypothetical protein